MKADVAYLCDTLCRGRLSGSGGMTECCRYVKGRLEKMGLPVEYQTFPLPGQDGRFGRNLIAVIKGSSPKAGSIIVCAHADGLGYTGGAFHPGADSNASGVAALLRIASELKHKGCKSDIVIAVLDGHSCDRAGARALQRRFRSPKLIASLDILGSDLAPAKSWETRYLYAIGGDAWKKALEAEAASLDGGSGGNYPQSRRMKVLYNYSNSEITRFFYSTVSDLGPFIEKGIPSVLFTSGITRHTNQPDDLPSTLNYPLLDERCRIICEWIRSL